ncbi:unnamed protein product [Rotaria sordida]|uniref:Uncharacterized protein n=1 Tax=Rotaria sordida TaxID=392033 RepID=A0A814GBX0_9BILA|nr:unnamed protein product [Rotaria sordida]
MSPTYGQNITESGVDQLGTSARTEVSTKTTSYNTIGPYNDTLTRRTNSFFQINIRLNDADAYLFNETATDFSITVSHPTRINDNVTINIDRIGYGQRCIVVSNSTTNVTIVLPSSYQLLGALVTVTRNKKQIRCRHK